MCDRLELIKAPAEKITDPGGQYQINQSDHSQISADLRPAHPFARGFGVQATGANRKRTIFFVNTALILSRNEVERLLSFRNDNALAMAEFCPSKETARFPLR